MWKQHQQDYGLTSKTWNIGGVCFLSLVVRGQRSRWELPGWFPERWAIDQEILVHLSAEFWYSMPPQNLASSSLCNTSPICRAEQGSLYILGERRRKATKLQTVWEERRLESCKDSTQDMLVGLVVRRAFTKVPRLFSPRVVLLWGYCSNTICFYCLASPWRKGRTPGW